MSKNELTLYLKKKGINEFIVVYLYVDDIISIKSSKYLIVEFKDCIMRKLEMTY